MQVSTFLGHWVNLNFIERIMMAYHIVSLGEKNELNGKSTDPKNTNRYPLASLLMHNTIVRKDIFVTIALLLILIYISLSSFTTCTAPDNYVLFDFRG